MLQTHDVRSDPQGKLWVVHTSLLFDSRAPRFLRNRSIRIDPATGLVLSIEERPAADIPAPRDRETHIDARGRTVLPGLVDSHTHIFLHGYAEAASIHQERDESLVERIVRATQHCRAALKAGYTTYRDLGTEGAGNADAGVRDAINRGIIPGPRLLVATQPLASSASYAIRYESSLNGTAVPPISDPCDGVDGVTAAVRRRVGAGADLVKFYADYRRRSLRFPPPAYAGAADLSFPPTRSARSPNSPLFNQLEMDAICAEARLAGIPVAAHATEPEAVIMASKAGVTTIEHGFVPSDAVSRCLLENQTIFVPTLSVLELVKDSIGEIGGDDHLTWERILGHTRAMWKAGVRIAAGGDTGAIVHGDNVREIELLVEAGMTVEAALQAATIRGWEACGGTLADEAMGEHVVGAKFGCLEPGWAADIVALAGDPRESMSALRAVEWVMKNGRFVVRDQMVLEAK